MASFITRHFLKLWTCDFLAAQNNVTKWSSTFGKPNMHGFLFFIFVLYWCNVNNE